MTNGAGQAARASEARAWARDAAGAVALAEGAISRRLLSTTTVALASPQVNAFGQEFSSERGDDAGALVARASQLAGAGERVAVVGRLSELVAARAKLAEAAAARVGLVAHALVDGGAGDVFALADLGACVLCASGAEESLDLTLVAHRAAEDSGHAFVVVHEPGHGPDGRGRHVEPILAPSRELCEGFLGMPGGPRAAITGDVSARAFAERAPFALGSAMRELHAMTGRVVDVSERLPAADADLALVGLGAIGDSLLAEVERLRAEGYDVCAVKITALRPFPGARLVKALSRALAITVLEGIDTPLAAGNPLTRELKAAFADALTWVPGFPGVGRIPRMASGIVPAASELEPADLDLAVANMLEHEHGKLAFTLGEESLGSPAAPPPAGELRSPLSPPRISSGVFSMRGRAPDPGTAEVCAELCSAVLASALGLRARASVRALPDEEGGGYAFDLAASRERPRGAHAPHAVRFLALDDPRELASARPLVRLAHGGVIAVPTAQRSADAFWSEMPLHVKAMIFDRGARLYGFPMEPLGEARSWLIGALYAGMSLAAAGADVSGPAGGSLVAREVSAALEIAHRHHGAPLDSAFAERAGQLARAAVEGRIEVPRATVERDQESIRMGRRDPRAG